MARVPDIPTAGPGLAPFRAGLTSIQQAAAPLAMASEFVGEVEQRFAEIQAQENQQRRSILYAEKKAELTRAFADLQRAAEESEDIEGIPEQFNQGAEQAVEGVMSSVQDEIVSAELQKFSVGALVHKQIAVQDIQHQRRADASLAALPGELDTYRDAIAIAKTDAEREALEMEARETIGLNPYLTEQQSAEMTAKFGRAVGLDAVSRMAESNPAALLAISSDAESFQSQFPGLDPSDRFTAKKTAQVQISHLETQRKAALKIAQDEEIDGFIDRFYRSDHPDGVPTVNEVLNSDLGPKLKEKFVKMAEDRANGVNLNVRNEALVNELYRRIHDEDHPQHITDPRELDPYLGEGLPRQDHEALSADIQSFKTDEGKIVQNHLKDFFKMAESQLTQTTLFGKDPDGEALFYQFKVEAQELYQRRVEEGKTPADLLDPRSPDYIGNLLKAPRYQRTAFDINNSQMRFFGIDTQQTRKVPERMEGESLADYIARTEE